MPRVKRGKNANKKRKRLLKHTKGYMWGRKSKERAAKDALLHAWRYSYRDRRNKKRDRRALWQIKINAAARQNGTTYSKLMGSLKKKGVALDRKILAHLAENEPETFKRVSELAREGGEPANPAGSEQ